RLSLKKGDIEFLPAPRDVLFFRRTYQQETTYVVCNPSTRIQKLRLPFRPNSIKILFPEQIHIENEKKNWYLLIQPESGCYLEEP
ncbi:MAG: alpha-glucosidase C-terminal domain-containing protein, partial [Planctomycetota bacterium]